MQHYKYIDLIVTSVLLHISCTKLADVEIRRVIYCLFSFSFRFIAIQPNISDNLNND